MPEGLGFQHLLRMILRSFYSFTALTHLWASFSSYPFLHFECGASRWARTCVAIATAQLAVSRASLIFFFSVTPLQWWLRR